MKRAFLAVALLASIGFSGCKKSSSSTTPTVTISPTSGTVETGAQLQFGATVVNPSSSSGTATTWLVNGVAGITAQQTAGDGTIDSTGLYTAPDAVPSSAAVVITAELTQDNSIFNTAVVDVTSVPVVNISPATVTVAAGQQTTLTICLFSVPEVNNVPQTGVTPYVNGIAGGNSVYGTIALTAVTGSPTCSPSLPNEPPPQQAVYTAPQVPPSNGQVVVTVVLNADNTQTADATITDTFSSFSMQGPFVFDLSGNYSFNQAGCVKSGYFARGGRFIADGQGGLAIAEDVNVAGSPPQTVQVNGTYTIGVDGRGTATVTDPSVFGCGTTASNYYIVFVNESKVQITEADKFATGHGEGDSQDPNVAFTGDLPANNFAFDFSGSSVVGGVTKPTSQIGEFTMSSDPKTKGQISVGQEDVNAGGALTPVPSGSLAGSFIATDATGRGTATIQGTSFAYYMINSGHVRFLELDALGTLAGDALQQPNNPTFSTSSLSAECAFIASGRSPTGFVATGGVFFADGATSQLSLGVLDQNDAGTVQSNAAASGSYSVDANGRGTASLATNNGTLTFVFYFVQAGQALLQETDSSIEADGMLVTEQGVPGSGVGFTTQSLVGAFAQQWTGGAASSFNEADTTGQIVLTGTTATVAGNWDTNTAFTLTPGNAVKGTYSMSGNGRGTLMLTDAASNTYNISIYIASLTPTGSMVFAVGTDASRVISGQLTQQF